VKLCRREPKRRYFFLFNDILVYASVSEVVGSTTPQYSFHRKFELDKCAVQPIADTEGTRTSTNTTLDIHTHVHARGIVSPSWMIAIQ